MADSRSETSSRKRSQTGSRKTLGSSSVIRKLGTGLSVQRTEDVAYRIAVDNVQDSMEYQKLDEVCRDPYQSDENYQWLVEFIERRASKFWQYLQYRESGKKDKDLIRAASILEYSRLLAGLVKSHPEFEGRFTSELVKHNPEEFRDKKPYTPAEFVEKLARHNEKDYLGIGPAPEPRPPDRSTLRVGDPAPRSPGQSPARKSPPAIPEFQAALVLADLCECLEAYVRKNLPEYKGFAFDSKCSILTRFDWIKIIEEFRKKHAELKGIPVAEVVEAMAEGSRDSRRKEIARYLRLYKI